MRAILAGLIFLLGTALGAGADTRVALVVGNSAYQNASRLPNPVNDATAVAGLFKSAGFETVELQTDLGANELRRAVRNFATVAQNADIAIVYFAGHGIEVEGTNYLLPVDAKLERDIDVEDESISLDRVLKIVEPAKRLRLVILDACRDNPFAQRMSRSGGQKRNVGRGLATVEPTKIDTLIAFAAKAGSTALDGTGRNSPFTAALLKRLIEPGVDLRIVFGQVRDDVLDSTGYRQEPFTYGSLGGAFVSLVPDVKRRPLPQAAATPDPRTDYQLAERVGTVEAWDYFLAIHDSGYYANLARAQRAKLTARPAIAAKPPSDPPRVVQPATSVVTVPAPPVVDTPKPAPPILPPPMIALATPSDPPKPTPPVVAAPQVDVAPLLQAELKRVGCEPGKPGQWDDRSRRALEEFNRRSGAHFDVKVASADALDAVRATSKRICPLACARGMRADGERCVRIACESGYVLGADGACQKRKEKPKAVARAPKPKARGGGNCLVFDGRRLCQ